MTLQMTLSVSVTSFIVCITHDLDFKIDSNWPTLRSTKICFVVRKCISRKKALGNTKTEDIAFYWKENSATIEKVSKAKYRATRMNPWYLLASNLVKGIKIKLTRRATPNEADRTTTMKLYWIFIGWPPFFRMAMVKGRPMPIRRLNKGPPKQAENPMRGYPAKEKTKNFSLIHFIKLQTLTLLLLL